jgi:hypothetical protein
MHVKTLIKIKIHKRNSKKKQITIKNVIRTKRKNNVIEKEKEIV